jgi:Na+-translocating ferredoxin:NAD+ oxidoreductase RnfG subunit
MYNRITLVILAIVALLFMHSTWSVYKKKVNSEEARLVTEERVMELRNRDNDLQNKIARLDTDSGIEAEIRSKFSVAKEDEVVVVVVSEEEDKSTTTLEKTGFWQRVRGWFDE